MLPTRYEERSTPYRSKQRCSRVAGANGEWKMHVGNALHSLTIKALGNIVYANRNRSQRNNSFKRLWSKYSAHEAVSIRSWNTAASRIEFGSSYWSCGRSLMLSRCHSLVCLAAYSHGQVFLDPLPLGGLAQGTPRNFVCEWSWANSDALLHLHGFFVHPKTPSSSSPLTSPFGSQALALLYLRLWSLVTLRGYSRRFAA